LSEGRPGEGGVSGGTSSPAGASSLAAGSVLASRNPATGLLELSVLFLLSVASELASALESVGTGKAMPCPFSRA
jgi:hypothetical protein